MPQVFITIGVCFLTIIGGLIAWLSPTPVTVVCAVWNVLMLIICLILMAKQ